MRNVKKLLAALLVATMLFSANGFTYAAETTESPVMQEEEVVDDSSSDSNEEEEAAVEEEAAEEDSSEEEALPEEGSEGQSDAAAEEETDKESSEEAAQPGTEDAASSETDGSDQQAQDTSAQDASADETTDAAQTEETTAAAEEEPVFTAGQLEAKGKDYEVLLTYEADAEIPDGAELKVEELKQDSDEYKECLKETESKVEKGIAEARFFDITIWADGQEIQPKENSTVRVNITYKKDAIEVAEEDNGEVQAVHFEDGTKDAKVLDTKTNEGSEVKDIEFDTKSFSIFGVIYTVDFTYDGYTFSIPGEGTILLSALAEQLNLAEKNFALENVKEVTFSNNELLKIEKQEDDWLLTSLKAFSTEETLTILMADGSKFLIVVTDAQANGRLTFYKTDGTTVDTSASVSSNYYIAAGNNNNISGVAKVQPQNGVANLSFGDADLSGCSFTLVQYTGSGDLTPAYASSNWWYDPNGALTKPSDFGLYTFNTSGGVNDLKAVKKGGYYVNLAFYDHDQQNPVIPGVTEGAKAIDQHAFVRVLLRDKDDNIVGYGIAPIPTNGSVNSIVIDRFTRLTGGNMSYAEAKAEGYSVPSGGANVRVGYKADANLPSYADFDDTSSTFTADPDGYTFAGQERIPPDERTVKLRVSDPSEYYVTIDCGKEALTLPSDADVYALVKATTATTTLYSFKKITSADTSDEGKTYKVQIDNDNWFNGSTKGTNQISGHEANVTVSLAVVAKDTPVNDPSVLTNKNNLIPLGETLQTHNVELYPSIDNGQIPSTDPVQRTYVNEPGVKSTYTDYVYLKKNEDSFDLYSLEKILSGGYNVVTLCPGENESMPKSIASTADVGQGDAFIGCHQMGSVLIRGDVTFAGKTTGVADSPNADNPNVIGGYFGDTSVKGCFFNGRTNNSDSYNVYLGSSNSIAGYFVNGNKYGQEIGGNWRGINYCGSAIVSDDYVDWSRLQRVVLDSSDALADAAADNVIVAAGGTVDVPLGSNVIIDCPDGASITVNIVGENAMDPEAPGTVINFLNTGDMTIPELKVNGAGLDTVETGEGMSVVYNYPNCTGTINGPGGSEFGHVVAPKALIKITGGNYSGTMVGNNVYLGEAAEGHLYPYRGEILIGFYGDLEFNKKVNNNTPTALQKYSFVLERLNDAIELSEDDSKFWEELQTVKNNGGKLSFNDVHFTKQGDYYFKVYEKTSTQEGVTTDTTKYLIKVSVGVSTSSEGKVMYSINSAKYYTIDDEDDLLVITRGEEYKGAAVNEKAITKSGSITWNQESSDKNVKMTGDLTFLNTVADTSVTLDGTKTLVGQDLTAGQFDFEVKDTTGKSPKKGSVVATGTNDAQGAIIFTSIPYDSDMFEGDDYEIQTDAETGDKYIELTYSVKEVMPAGATEETDYTVDGIKYDHSEKTVTVKVTAHVEGGNITAEVTTGKDSISFENTAVKQKGYLKVKKTISGATLTAAKTFKFTVKGKGEDGLYYYLDGTTTKSSETEQYVEVTVPAGSTTAESSLLELPLGEYTVTEYTGTNYGEIAITGYDVTSFSDPVDCDVNNETTEQAPAEAEITNTYTEQVISISATKEWDDNDNQDGYRTAVKFHLNRKVGEGEPAVIAGQDKTIPANATGDALTVTWDNLPKYQNGQLITYSVTEDRVAEYTTDITGDMNTGFTVKNTHETEKTEATVKKVWDDAENQDGKRPESLTVTLSNGTEVTLNEDNSWTATVENLPKYANGQEIEYTWTEGGLPEGYTLTNTVKEGTLSRRCGMTRTTRTESALIA